MRGSPTVIGYPITAIVRSTLTPGERCSRYTGFVENIPEVLTCYRVTGSDALIMKVMAASIEHLELLIDQLDR